MLIAAKRRAISSNSTLPRIQEFVAEVDVWTKTMLSRLNDGDRGTS